MKTKEELNALKAEVETMSRKLAELTDEELAWVAGGIDIHHNGYWWQQKDYKPFEQDKFVYKTISVQQKPTDSDK